MQKNKKSRAELRGIPLSHGCDKASIITLEYGENDIKMFCYGLYDCATEELIDACAECKANIRFAKPFKWNY